MVIAIDADTEKLRTDAAKKIRERLRKIRHGIGQVGLPKEPFALPYVLCWVAIILFLAILNILFGNMTGKKKKTR